MMKRSLRNEIALLKDTYTEEDLYNFSTQIFQRLTETEEFKKAIIYSEILHRKYE